MLLSRLRTNVRNKIYLPLRDDFQSPYFIPATIIIAAKSENKNIASSGFMFLLPANTKRRLPLRELEVTHIHKVQSFI